MNNFPLICDLPEVLSADLWQWEQTKFGRSDEFWVGTDPQGNRWIVKMRGSFRAWCERTFAMLAQKLGLSCQSSVYLSLPLNCKPMCTKRIPERYQLAIWLLKQHDSKQCHNDCPISLLYNGLNDPQQDRLSVLKASSVRNAIDLARGELLGYLCNASEIAEYIVTPNHELVLIDNELTFFDFEGRQNILEAHYLKSPSGKISHAGLKFAIDLCEKFSRISDSEIEKITTLPKNYYLDRKGDIKPLVFDARNKAKEFLRTWN